MPRRVPLHLLLALLLLLAQQLAGAHALSHQDPAPLADHACQLCATSAQLGASLPSVAPTLAAATPAPEQAPWRTAVIAPQTRVPFQSRAPPPAL